MAVELSAPGTHHLSPQPSAWVRSLECRSFCIGAADCNRPIRQVLSMYDHHIQQEVSLGGNDHIRKCQESYASSMCLVCLQFKGDKYVFRLMVISLIQDNVHNPGNA